MNLEKIFIILFTSSSLIISYYIKVDLVTSKYLKVIACPDCKGTLRDIRINQRLLGCYCEKCKLIYPIKNGIFILLPKNARNYDLEYNLVLNLKSKLESINNYRLGQIIKNTLKLLHSMKDVKTWEWDDEEFWSKEYKKEKSSMVEKNWNDRLWQREVLVNQLVDRSKLNKKTILDVGCGEGQNFRLLLSRFCDKNTLYIATDISYNGLQLNRIRSKHKNSIYILCTADKLPFQNKAIDILCYFGILHHTQRKTATIPQDSRLVKPGGYILIHEAMATPTLATFLPGLYKSTFEESEHEERIDKYALLKEINSNKNLRIIRVEEIYSLFLSIMLQVFSNVMINNKTFFQIISKFDNLFIKLFGKLTRLFAAREIMVLVHKS